MKPINFKHTVANVYGLEGQGLIAVTTSTRVNNITFKRRMYVAIFGNDKDDAIARGQSANVDQLTSEINEYLRHHNSKTV